MTPTSQDAVDDLPPRQVDIYIGIAIHASRPDTPIFVNAMNLEEAKSKIFKRLRRDYYLDRIIHRRYGEDTVVWRSQGD